MKTNRQKTESTQCQPETQLAEVSTQPTLNQHPLKEYSKYVPPLMNHQNILCLT